MSIEITTDRIVLNGRCGVEEAETLLAALVERPERVVVVDAERIHTALWQVMIALKPQVSGRPPDPFVMQYIMPLVLDSRAVTKQRSEE